MAARSCADTTTRNNNASSLGLVLPPIPGRREGRGTQTLEGRSRCVELLGRRRVLDFVLFHTFAVPCVEPVWEGDSCSFPFDTVVESHTQVLTLSSSSLGGAMMMLRVYAVTEYVVTNSCKRSTTEYL